MRKRKCKQCGTSFEPSQRSRKFCSLECCWQWRKENKDKLKGTFKVGLQPWNKGTKGVMQPNSGSFKKGCGEDQKLPVGTKTIRIDKQKKQRRWIKIADNATVYDWVLYAVYLWESRNGPVPKGSVIHHKDRDTLNDKLSNLQVMTRSEHLLEHRSEHEPRRAKRAADATRARHKRNRLLKTTGTP